MSEIAPRRFLYSIAVGLLAVAAGFGWAVRSSLVVESSATLTKSTGSKSQSERRSRRELTLSNHAESMASGKRHPVIVRRPDGPPRVDLGTVDADGNPVTAACSTCHATRPANANNRKPADLNEFHQNMAFAHGRVSCLSCHNPNDYDTLHLADGQSVEYADVMTLCAQCHGPQTRDFEHGAHGGMQGHWDLSKGPRTRNNCVDCHDPHTPGFPAMKPTFKPKDRFLNPHAPSK